MPSPPEPDRDATRSFFAAQHKRFHESQRLQAYQSGEEHDVLYGDDDDFSPDEARKLLWEGEDMRQPVVGYRILQPIGQGGMATIFKVLEAASEQEMAIKLLYPGLVEDTDAVQRFVREGMTLIRLDHPNILKGHDFGISKGFYFLTLDLLTGRSLQDLLDSGKRLGERVAVRIARGLAAALVCLSEHGIVHRDLKPANVMLTDALDVKLLDFGLCLETDGPQLEEKADTTCGTLEYLSPEQAKGAADLDARADLYSLGATLYHVIAGKPPFQAENARELMRAQIYDPLVFDPGRRFSRPMRLLIGRLMEKDPANRYASAAELSEDLDRLFPGS